MHELAITEGILEAAVPEAQKHGAKRILEIRLKIGEMSGVIPSCVEEYLKLITPGTIAEGAKLKVEYIPVTIKCLECGYEGPVDRLHKRCPDCESRNVRVTGGNEYYVDSLEVE